MERINLKPFALVRSKTMKLVDEGDVPVDYSLLSNRLLEASRLSGGVPIVADVTASSTVQDHYKGWLSQGISVVAANKGIFAGPESTYRDLLAAASSSPKARLLHETTVGAGLPVLGTLGDLKASSHSIVSVEGILSGTLAFVLGAVAGGRKSLSEAVGEARALGYTEPDPRDDLNGMDVARKAVILARVAGMVGVEHGGMAVESLVPEELRDASVDDFMDGLSEYDAAFAERVSGVEKTGGRLHYAAKVDVESGKVDVGPLAVEASHPFNNAGPDNMVAITTNFYSRPLVVQGAGAGGDVTATGVLADILKCAH